MSEISPGALAPTRPLTQSEPSIVSPLWNTGEPPRDRIVVIVGTVFFNDGSEGYSNPILCCAKWSENGWLDASGLSICAYYKEELTIHYWADLPPQSEGYGIPESYQESIPSSEAETRQDEQPVDSADNSPESFTPPSQPPITSTQQVRQYLEEWMLANLHVSGESVTPELIAEEIAYMRFSPDGAPFSLMEAQAHLSGLMQSVYLHFGGFSGFALPEAERQKHAEIFAWLESLKLPSRVDLSSDEAEVLKWYRAARAAAAQETQGSAGKVQVLYVGDSKHVALVGHLLGSHHLAPYLPRQAIVYREHQPSGDEAFDATRNRNSKLCVTAHGFQPIRP